MPHPLRLATHLSLCSRAAGVLLLLQVLACSGQVAQEPGAQEGGDGSPEAAWLEAIGTGAAQTARVCERGATDRVARALCGDSAPAIGSLEDLYRALQLAEPEQRYVAATTHSLGLSARSVSAANPRVLLFPNTSTQAEPLAYEQVVATGFTRGEQRVELLGLDPATYEYNFYLLTFEQTCNRSRCSPEDLLTSKVESDWSAWTLYSDRELEDTPLDCVTCHQPFGAGSHKQMLMRQVVDPWMHWSDFRGGDETLCPELPPEGEAPKVIATSDGLDLLEAIEGTSGSYAGVPLPELQAARSGEVLADYLIDAELLIQGSPAPPHLYEQLAFRTREALCERFHTGASPSWDEDRRLAQARGLPVPFYAPDILDPERRAELRSDRAGWLRRFDTEQPFELATSLIDEEAARAIGFVPRPEDGAPEILRALCSRCHAASTPANLARARFDVDALDAVEPATFRAVRERLSLPKDSPRLMPPQRVADLPDWAIERIITYLEGRCATPGGCR